MDLELRDRIALVTGASHGLGRAIALVLAAEGARVAINCRRRPEEAETLAGEIVLRGGDATVVLADVSASDEVDRMFVTLEDHLGGPADILVNNAALCPTAWLAELTDEQWNDTLAVNLSGAFYCCRAFARRLQAVGRPGRIVNVVSQAAFRGSTTGHAPYDASKGGLVSLTIALAKELAKQQIAVNAIAPGMMRTEMTATTLDANLPKYLARIPLRRLGTPEEIADMVAFLASPRASYMTGATIDASGGMLMR